MFWPLKIKTLFLCDKSKTEAFRSSVVNRKELTLMDKFITFSNYFLMYESLRKGPLIFHKIVFVISIFFFVVANAKVSIAIIYCLTNPSINLWHVTLLRL